METITIKRVMDRLMDNPNMENLKHSTAGAYIKDMLSLNKISGTLIPKEVYLQPEDGIATLPTELVQLRGVYYCDPEVELEPSMFASPRLVSATTHRTPNITQVPQGTYRTEYGSIFLTTDDPILIEYYALPVDSYGYPTLPYDGSLMEAVTNWVKYKHYSVLAECQKIPFAVADRAHREYTWYIGQYTMNNDIPSYDEAVAFANTWQRLVDTRTVDPSTDGFREHLKL